MKRTMMSLGLTALIAGPIDVCLASPSSGENEKISNLLLHDFSHSHPSHSANLVSADPSWSLKESTEQQVAWKLVLKRCTPVETGNTVERSCFDALSAYYIDQPVWDYSKMHYFDSLRGVTLVEAKYINHRPFVLPYGYEDYAIGKVPLWGDIFDGNVAERQSRYLKVIADDSCLELSTRQHRGMNENLAERCAAREMYKYATYLEACMIAIQRLSSLDATADQNEISGHHSVYDVSVNLIEKHVNVFESRNLAVRRMQKGYLHAHWVTKQCSSNDLILDPNPWLTNQENPVAWSADQKFFLAIAQTHDIALKIAAKSGDEWAIRSFPLNERNSIEFNEDVARKYPLLMHRHLASSASRGLGRQLDSKERMHHKAKAYLMIEELAGSQVAQEEIDISKLREEINFVLNGGKLKYPFFK